MILAKRQFFMAEILRKTSFIALLFLLQVALQGQNDSTTRFQTGIVQQHPIPAMADSTILYLSSPEEQKLSIKNSTQQTDTILDNLHNYYQMGVLGNIGLPSYSLLAGGNTYTDNSFFRWMNLNNQNDLLTSKQPVYFYPQGKVYTKIFAAMGQKLEQVFKITHSQNIRRVNISLQFNRYSCIGFYQNQKSLTDNLLLSSHAQTKNARVGYHFYFLFNKLKYQTNGGIDTSRVDFEKNVLVQKQLFPVLLSTAKQNLRTLEANFNTFLKLNSDTVGALHFLEYQTNYRGNYWIYTDGPSDSAFFTNNYFTNTTGLNKDSISFKQWSNTFNYSFKFRSPYGNDQTVFYAGYKNEFNHYHQFSIDTMAMNHILMGGFATRTDKVWGSLKGQHVMSGFNAGNYNYDLSGGVKIKKFYFSLDANVARQKPAFMNEVYTSPHFIWSNTFKNTESSQANIEFGSNKYRFKLGAIYTAGKNMVYYDTLGLPRQYAGMVNVNRFYLQKDLRLGPIHFNNMLNYQTVSADIIRLPQYYTFHQLYYEGKLFKKALWLQFGVQARYISAFKANAYMPATNQFYLQNQKEYGNYVFIDIFLNAQIDRFRFFLLASHINQGLSGANYMLCPNYAMPDRSLKAGLCWMFFD